MIPLFYAYRVTLAHFPLYFPNNSILSIHKASPLLEAHYIANLRYQAAYIAKSVTI